MTQSYLVCGTSHDTTCYRESLCMQCLWDAGTSRKQNLDTLAKHTTARHPSLQNLVSYCGIQRENSLQRPGILNKATLHLALP